MKILNRQIAINHLFDTDPDEFKGFCRRCTALSYSFLVIDTTLPSNNALHFRINLFEEE